MNSETNPAVLDYFKTAYENERYNPLLRCEKCGVMTRDGRMTRHRHIIRQTFECLVCGTSRQWGVGRRPAV